MPDNTGQLTNKVERPTFLPATNLSSKTLPGRLTCPRLPSRSSPLSFLAFLPRTHAERQTIFSSAAWLCLEWFLSGSAALMTAWHLGWESETPFLHLVLFPGWEWAPLPLLSGPPPSRKSLSRLVRRLVGKLRPKISPRTAAIPCLCVLCCLPPSPESISEQTFGPEETGSTRGRRRRKDPFS